MTPDEVMEEQEVEVSGEEVVAEMQQDAVDAPESQEPKETMVPLSALQKERKKRQELELMTDWQKQQMQQLQQMQRPVEPIDDTSKYESATKEDLGKSREEIIRQVEENIWIKANPEKAQYVDANLPQFLNQRRNLTSAIRDSSNRYEEAYTLMEALTPKQKQQLRTDPVPKKQAPNSPANVPKGASLQAAVDVMSMNDTEYRSWRDSQKKRR